MVGVDKTYRFETDEGSASLADLFRGRSQLLSITSCWARLHGGVSVVLGDRGRVQRLRRPPGEPRRDALGGVAGAAREAEAYKRRMGWSFPGRPRSDDFNFDFSVSFTEEQQREGGMNTTTERAATHWTHAGTGARPGSRLCAEPMRPRLRASGRA